MVHQSQLPQTGQTTQGKGSGRASELPHESQEEEEERTKAEKKQGGGQRGIEMFGSPASSL